MMKTARDQVAVRAAAASRQEASPSWLTGALLRRLAGWLVEFELVVLALTAPVLLFPRGPSAVVLLALPVLWMARRVSSGRFVPSTPLDWPIFGMLAMVLVSLFVTFDLQQSLSKVMGLLLGVATYYAIVDRTRTEERLRRAFGVFAAAGCAVALAGLVGTRWPPDKIALIEAIEALLPPIVRGFPGAEMGFHPNQVAGVLLWFVPLQVALATWLWRRRADPLVPVRLRHAALISTAVMLFMMLLTQSRSAFSGLALGLGLLAWLALPRARPLLAGVVLATALAVLSIGPGELAERLFRVPPPEFTTTDDLLTLKGRGEIWSSALAAVADHPWSGVGMNTFRQLARSSYPVPFAAPDGDFGHAHNHLLQAALDLGLPGMLAYLALWLVAAGMLWQLKWCARGWTRAAAAGIMASLWAYFVYGLTDAVALGAKPGVFFWALLALLVATWSTQGKSAPEPPAST